MKRADELLDAEFIAKWQDRRAVEPFAWRVLEAVLRRFVDVGGPVGAEEVAAARLPGHDAAELYGALAQLDEKDLILVRDGRILLAYPFAGMPTAFSVILPGGRERHAVCAIDALGVPALLGEPVVIRASCYHCGTALEIQAGPEGPTGDLAIMVWVGKRGELREKAFSSL